MLIVRLEKFYLEHPEEALLTPHAGHSPDVGHGVHGQLRGLLEDLSLDCLGVDDDPHMKVGGSYEGWQESDGHGSEDEIVVETDGASKKNPRDSLENGANLDPCSSLDLAGLVTETRTESACVVLLLLKPGQLLSQYGLEQARPHLLGETFSRQPEKGALEKTFKLNIENNRS